MEFNPFLEGEIKFYFPIDSIISHKLECYADHGIDSSFFGVSLDLAKLCGNTSYSCKDPHRPNPMDPLRANGGLVMGVSLAYISKE